jgi:hypothetical protein
MSAFDTTIPYTVGSFSIFMKQYAPEVQFSVVPVVVGRYDYMAQPGNSRDAVNLSHVILESLDYRR